jgi:hypothetical protein
MSAMHLGMRCTLLSPLVKKDERFFFGDEEGIEVNYNYTANDVLIEAIKRGHQGSFWDILRRLAEEGGYYKGLHHLLRKPL